MRDKDGIGVLCVQLQSLANDVTDNWPIIDTWVRYQPHNHEHNNSVRQHNTLAESDNQNENNVYIFLEIMII